MRDCSHGGADDSEQGEFLRHRKTLTANMFSLFKYVLALALIITLFSYGGISVEDLAILLSSPVIWLAVTGLIVLALLIGVVRWKQLLYASGIDLPYWGLFRIYCIGAFIGTFLPGAVGQDAVRTVYLVQQTPRGKTGAALSVVADRVVGLFGFLSISVLFIWFQRDVMLASAVTSALAFSVIAFFIVMVIGGGLLLAAAGPLSRAVFLQGSRSRWLVRQRLFQVFCVVMGFKGHVKILLFSWFLSMIIPLLLVGCLVLFGMVRSGHPLSATELMLGGFIANIANTIPLTPGGLGIGEGAFDQVCRMLESKPSGAAYGSIFLAFRAATIIVNLVLGATFLLFGQHYRLEKTLIE